MYADVVFGPVRCVIHVNFLHIFSNNGFRIDLSGFLYSDTSANEDSSFRNHIR